MKAKATLTEGRKDIILFLVEEKDEWTNPSRIVKKGQPKTMGSDGELKDMGYHGVLKALKEMGEKGIIELKDISRELGKPIYHVRCLQDLIGFKNLTNAVIDTGDVAFFIKYTSSLYFDKWCSPLIDDVMVEGYNNHMVNNPILGGKIDFSLDDTKIILKISPSALKLILKKMDNELLESILALSFSTFGKSADECADKGGKLRPTFFCELIHKAFTVDYLLNPALIEEAQKHFARK